MLPKIILSTQGYSLGLGISFPLNTLVFAKKMLDGLNSFWCPWPHKSAPSHLRLENFRLFLVIQDANYSNEWCPEEKEFSKIFIWRKRNEFSLNSKDKREPVFFFWTALSWLSLLSCVINSHHKFISKWHLRYNKSLFMTLHWMRFWISLKWDWWLHTLAKTQIIYP